MYRIAVCDDEPLFLHNAKTMTASILREAGIVHQIDGYMNAQALRSQLETQPKLYNILILDILLGDENGIHLAKTLRDTGYTNSILFVTSSKEFSLEGYSVYPIHYLIKPLQEDALREVLLRDYEKNYRPASIPIPIKGGLTHLTVDSVLYIESLGRVVIIHTKDRDMEVTMPLREVWKLLPPGTFAQCHKSFLVSMGQIRDLTRMSVELKSGQTLPVGRVYYEDTLSVFTEYLGK